MIDARLLLEDVARVERSLARRGVKMDLTTARELLVERNAMRTRVDEQRAEINALSKEVANASADKREDLLKRARDVKRSLALQEASYADLEDRLTTELKRIPNILRDDVPNGLDASQNVVVRSWGEPTVHAFQAKDHVALGEHLDILDIERAGKVSGSRFVYLKGDAVLLQNALYQYALSVLLPEGFVPVLPPHLISTEAMGAMGYLEKGGEEEIYHLKHDALVLIGTSEQAIGPMHMREHLAPDALPRRYVGFSPCYRREAGSYGKDVRGILRLHQFDKVEMFSFTSPDASDDEHEFLLSMEERLMQGLGLPYRVVKLCAGDTGFQSARTYDLETWIPSEGVYRETHSTSNTVDFQTRRLQTRLKMSGEGVVAHALNGTAFAMGRTILAMLENFQQEDGSVLIPSVLHPYMMGRTRIVRS